MIELFAARKVTSPFLKRSERLAGKTLSAAAASIKKFSILLIKSKEGRGTSRVDWRSSFSVAVETCSAHGILKLSRQIAHVTNKYQVGSETVVVHALLKATAIFSRSGVDKLVLEDLRLPPCCPP